MIRNLKNAILSFRPLRDGWSVLRSRQQEALYRRHREYYAARRREPRVLATPLRRASMGQVHTFAIISTHAWHGALLGDLRQLGPLTHFDYEFRFPRASGFVEWRRRMNQDLLDRFARAHRKQPVDWVFAYAEGKHLLASTVRALRETFAVPAVNMCLDDKQSWQGQRIDGQWSGSIGLASAFDLWWTSARVTVDWVNAEGGHALYLPEGFEAAACGDGAELPYRIPVSFVGAAYGRRTQMVEYLRRHAVPVQAFGAGWGPDSRVSDARMIEIFRTSQINLGHGGIGYSERFLNVKGRDFDIPALGGGAYITTFNPDLALHYNLGTEIACWHSYDDLLEQVRWLLARPEACRQLARAARQRCLREHRWLHRYQAVLEYLGVLQPPAVARAARSKEQAT